MPRGTGRGEIEKRGKRWRARYAAPDGSRPSKTFDSKQAARAWLTEQHALIDTDRWKPQATIKAERFGEYAQTWLKTHRTNRGTKQRSTTKKERERYLKKGLAPFANTPITSITPASVRSWHSKRVAQITQARRDEAEAKGKDPNTVLLTGETAAAREAGFLRTVLNTAVEDGIIPTNPVPKNLTKSSSRVPHRIPTTEELAAILHHMPEEWKAAVILAAFGGLRFGEWKALRRSDLTLREHPVTGERFYEVSVTRQAQHISNDGWEVGAPKSEEGIRETALPAHVTEQITNHLDTYTGKFASSLLFPPAKGDGFIHDSVFRKRWNAAKARAGVPDEVRVHDLRGFAGTMYAQQGATLKEIQAFLGHGTVAAAMVYQSTTGRGAELANRIPALPTYTEESNVTQLRKES